MEGWLQVILNNHMPPASKYLFWLPSFNVYSPLLTLLQRIFSSFLHLRAKRRLSIFFPVFPEQDLISISYFTCIHWTVALSSITCSNLMWKATTGEKSERGIKGLTESPSTVLSSISLFHTSVATLNRLLFNLEGDSYTFHFCGSRTFKPLNCSPVVSPEISTPCSCSP